MPTLTLLPLCNLAEVCRFRVLIAVFLGLGRVRGPVTHVAEPLSAIPRPDRGPCGPKEAWVEVVAGWCVPIGARPGFGRVRRGRTGLGVRIGPASRLKEVAGRGVRNRDLLLGFVGGRR